MYIPAGAPLLLVAEPPSLSKAACKRDTKTALTPFWSSPRAANSARSSTTFNLAGSMTLSKSNWKCCLGRRTEEIINYNNTHCSLFIRGHIQFNNKILLFICFSCNAGWYYICFSACRLLLSLTARFNSRKKIIYIQHIHAHTHAQRTHTTT